jgi:Tfp pilus assembly protein PilO
MIRRLPDLREARGTVALVVVLGLGVNLAALFLLNVPLDRSLATSREEVAGLMQRVEGRRREVSDLNAQVERIRAQVIGLDRFFNETLAAKSQRMVAVQRELRAIAERHSIRPETVSYFNAPADKTRNMVRFGATFPLSGSYQALRSFIHDVEHSPHFLIIDSVDLTNAREGGALLALDISVSTLFHDPDYQAIQGGAS